MNRCFIRIVAIVTAIATAPLALAQGYPAKVVKLVNPFPAGGFGDLLSRELAAGLTSSLHQQVVVENRPGAANIVAAQTVAKAPTDGYTLLFTSNTGLVLNVSAYKNLPYDPVRDFAPVALCFTSPLYVAVRPSVPATSVQELIALAKSRPGKLTFGSGGHGTMNHLAGELFKSLAQVEMLHVPYKGAAPAWNDLVAGQIDLFFGPGGLNEARAGRVRVLAVTSARRSAAAPELPTMQEAGLRNYEATVWFGVVAPTGTPGAIVRRLSGEIRKVLGDPEIRERFSTVDVTPSTPEEFAAFIQSEIPKWRKVFQIAKIEPE